ncbi:MAG: type II toxin-antitoxin system VapC family toxin [Phenylobacterium sp.]
MIVVDSSALVAIAEAEPEAGLFAEILADTDIAWLSPTNYVETAMVLIGRGLIADRARLDRFLADSNVQVRHDLSLSEGAVEAFLRYGKGRHPARLNLGDCFAYALAKRLDAPLLYKGDDFALTDVRAAG